MTHTPTKPVAENSDGVSVPPTTEPRHTHSAQMPVAEPILSGATYF